MRRDARDLPPHAPPKLPPPAHGIRVRRIGATWWGQRWVDALARFGAPYWRRLGRGKVYARQGRVHDLTVVDGVVTASVTGTRPEPYRVTLRLTPLADRAWAQAIRAMAARARFAARLLAGEMPREIGEAFAAARTSLFPTRAGDLRTECTCPDPANPCKHVAALHYVLAEAFDANPFLLFELRGRSKDAVLAELRRLRAGRRDAAPAAPRPEPDAPPEGVTLAGLTPDRYEALREPVADLAFHIAAPAVEGAVLRQLGAPPGWSIPVAPAQLLGPAVAAAARLAREMAFSPVPDDESAPATPPAAQ